MAGSDSLGRDIWSRVIYGTRVSLAVAIVAATVSLLIGTTVGTVSGFAGGRVDNLIMRVVDFLYAVPLLPIIILMQVYFQALAHAGRILLFSPYVTAQQAKTFGITKIDDLNATVQRLIRDSGRVVIVPEGPYVGCLNTSQ